MHISTPPWVPLSRNSNAHAGPLGELMQRYIDGDERAFTEMYRRLRPRLLGLIQRRVSDREAARDLAQVVFTRAHRARSRYVTPPGRDRDRAVWTWYAAIARNASTDFLRRGYSQRARATQVNSVGDTDAIEFFGDDSPNPEERLLHAEQEDQIRARVRGAIACLPANQREVVQLHKLDGLSMRAISSQLHVREGTLRVRGHRAYKALVARLSSTDDKRGEFPGTAAAN
jgi:RNA polymerase sigma-70 factor (ECF subfamily)